MLGWNGTHDEVWQDRQRMEAQRKNGVNSGQKYRAECFALAK